MCCTKAWLGLGETSGDKGQQREQSTRATFLAHSLLLHFQFSRAARLAETNLPCRLKVLAFKDATRSHQESFWESSLEVGEGTGKQPVLLPFLLRTSP